MQRMISSILIDTTKSKPNIRQTLIPCKKTIDIKIYNNLEFITSIVWEKSTGSNC